MGVDFATVTGFGIVLSEDEIEAVLRHLGIKWEHDEPEQELLDLFAVQMSECGNCYVEKGRRYLYHAKESRDPETGSTQVDQEQVAELKRMVAECNLDKKVAFQEEEHLY
jgi:hypothetical protein